MANRLEELDESVSRSFLSGAALRGISEEGYQVTRQPGRGLSSVWQLGKNGHVQRASIRTTRDRSIAFPPQKKGTRWKTLDDVDLVVVAAVDSKENPTNVEVYVFPAEEVRRRFNMAYAARTNAGLMVRDDFGMWVGLDRDDRNLPASIGSGIRDQYKPVAIYPIEEMSDDEQHVPTQRVVGKPTPSEPRPPAGSTINDVMLWARQRVAEIAGVRIEAVKLDLKIEY